MKNITTLFLILFSQSGFSQDILQMRTVPANPTPSDTVLLLADLEFRYSGCDLDNKTHYISGNSIVASTHHCIGIAAALCYPTDTFNLGLLNPGVYTVNLSLTQGMATVPCTPGFAVSDTASFNFTVQTGLGIPEIPISSFSVYPNPTTDFIDLSEAYKSVIKSVKILSADGSLVLEYELPSDRIDVSKLAAGIYYLELYHNTGKVTEKFIKE
jgi:hypothetical protein